mmetsp:Transcript_39323/g.82493  ORF Transcript_39323/g.82493 Transcript_39323/m.82493 type:complete len:86 (-) Transcript_39323:351-608(-)
MDVFLTHHSDEERYCPRIHCLITPPSSAFSGACSFQRATSTGNKSTHAAIFSLLLRGAWQLRNERHKRIKESVVSSVLLIRSSAS